MKKVKLIDLVKQRYKLDEKEAIGFILSGNVLVNDQQITKIGFKIDPTLNIRIRTKDKYVSRGAYKLLYALDKFSISLENKICIDCGSSTGGFTQVLLEGGAKKVYAVDCGVNLIHYSLRNNTKVVIMEDHKVRELKIEDFNDNIDFAVMDISFSSSIFPIEHLFNNIKIKNAVVLIKPQFEYNRLKKKLSLADVFNGIVANESDREKIVSYVIDEIKGLGLNIFNIAPSSIKGTKGNLEYFLCIGKDREKQY